LDKLRLPENKNIWCFRQVIIHKINYLLRYKLLHILHPWSRM